mmetsp:Transcript_17577/g.36492  ORF Transcript_17577/g.36492 Transcript_17577/m.36492 type:complete len:94 (+) Transcript_17577:3641-3922(+)
METQPCVRMERNPEEYASVVADAIGSSPPNRSSSKQQLAEICAPQTAITFQLPGTVARSVPAKRSNSNEKIISPFSWQMIGILTAFLRLHGWS